MGMTHGCDPNLLEPKIMEVLEKIAAADVDGTDRAPLLVELEAHVSRYVALAGFDPYETIVAAWDFIRVTTMEELESSSGEQSAA